MHKILSFFLRPAFFLFPVFVFINVTAQQLRTIKLHKGDAQVMMSTRQDLIRKEIVKGRWNENYYFLVCYDKKPEVRNLNFLKQINAEVLESLSDNFLLIRVKSVPSSDFFSIAGIKGISQLPAEEKISKKLQDLMLNSGEESLIRVSVLLHSGERLPLALTRLNQLGFIPVKEQYSGKGLIIGNVSKSKIMSIAAFPCVKYVGLFDYEPKPLLFRESGVLGFQNIRNSNVGMGLTGKGVTVGIGDDADPTSHLDNRYDNYNRNPNAIRRSAHGTAVTGIVSSDGLIDERFTGVAPQSSTVTDFYDLIIAKTETYAKDFGMTVTNNSYYNGYANCPGNGEYNELSVYADDQIISSDTIQHIFAAGNDGQLICSPYSSSFGTIKSGYQTSKNVLSVGDYSFSSNPRTISVTSSRGPVADGRLKPEMVAPGNAVNSTTLNNAYSGQHWGTSFAAPFVAGVSSLLTEQYRKKFNGKTPASGLLKSILCNSSSDKGNPGPDFTYGYGLLNPARALNIIDKNQFTTDSVTAGAQKSYSIQVPAGVKQIKIMLYWNDRPGSPLSLKALQNDLDLTVADGSDVYLPWILNSSPVNVNNLASRGVDRLNNIEQVTIDNPGTSLTLNVIAQAFTSVKQTFYLTWDFIKEDLKILRPASGEKLTAGAPGEIISWDAMDNTNDSISIEYSLDNGQTWTFIANTNISRMFIGWAVPSNIASSQAKIRLRRLRDGAIAVTPGVFTIIGLPQLNITTVCDGAVDLTWNDISNATDYEILQLKGNEWISIGITTDKKYSIRGLNKSATYWFTVRARVQGAEGRRAAAKSVNPRLDTPCQSDEFNNDLSVDSLLSSIHGRRFTSTAFGKAESIRIRVKNLDNASTSGVFNLFYQINNGSVISEQINAVIPQGTNYEYTFNTKADLSLPGNYNLSVWVKQAGDSRPENDTAVYIIRHLDNLPISLPHTDNFENTDKNEYLKNTFALEDIERFDLSMTSNNGRARTFVNTGMSLEGNRAITMDAVQQLDSININRLTATYNFSGVPLSEGLRLDFLYKNQGQLKLPNSILWMRGSDTSAWIKAFEMTNSQSDLDSIRKVWINIYEHLTKAGQGLSSSFQIMIEQTGRTSSNNASYFTDAFDLDDGLTVDDFRFVNASNDMMLSKIIQPESLVCSNNNNQYTVIVKVKNNSSNQIANIPVFYRLNNGNVISEIISFVPGNTEIDYSFLTGISDNNSGSNQLDVWIASPGDNYRTNDSIIGYPFYSRKIVSSFPYLERFESNDGGWYTTGAYSTWKWGTVNPFFRLTVNRAANGTKAWFTGLDQSYNSNEFSYLYTPCFDLSKLNNPVLSFSHISQQERGVDFHLLEYSLDNGTSWQSLGVSSSGINWYDTAANFWNTSVQRWHVSSTDLPFRVSNIRFRFLISSNESVFGEGIGIDDFHIFEKKIVYEGANVNITNQVAGNNFVDFAGQGNLIASINPLGQNLGSVNVSAYINTDSVRLINSQYYLDRNLVIQSQFIPTDSVIIRFYFTDNEINRMLFTTRCTTCIKLQDAYLSSVTKYNGAEQFENGILNDGAGGMYEFINASEVDIVPFNNGYYAEFKVKSFSEFWLHATNLNLTQVPVAVNNPEQSTEYIRTTMMQSGGHLRILTGNLQQTRDMHIRLINANGQQVYQSVKPYQYTDIHLPGMASGIYFIEITDRSGMYKYRNKLIMP